MRFRQQGGFDRLHKGGGAAIDPHAGGNGKLLSEEKFPDRSVNPVTEKNSLRDFFAIKFAVKSGIVPTSEK